MKKTLQIARLEMNLLFYSPIAWLVMIALFLQLAFVFVPIMVMLEKSHEWIQMYPRYHMGSLTYSTLMHPSGGVLGAVLPFLYMYSPLITMGLISRETSSGTINLLYSSPLNIRQIVFGKFIAMLLYNLLIVGLFILVVIGAGAYIPHLDYPHVMVGILGIYLLFCAYAAIGLFMSCLTTYQVVAAILTFAALALLNYVGGFFQGTDFWRDVMYSLWIAQRPVKMLSGLLTTRDTIYFLAIIYMFIAMTIGKLWMDRNAKKWSFKILCYVLIIVSGSGITYLTSRPGLIGYYDATFAKVNTISKHSQEILQNMGDAPVEVTEYVNFLDISGYFKAAPERRNEDVDRWEPYIRFKPNIHLNWVYYYDSLSPANGIYKLNSGKGIKQIFDETVKFSGIGRNQFRTPAEIRKIVQLGEEGDRVVMKLRYKDRTTYLRTFDDPMYWPSEAEISAALKRMLVKLPRVIFVSDGYERTIDKMGDRDYKVLTNRKTYRNSLINQGFDMDTMSLRTGEIPEGIAALVIGDRRTELDTVSLKKIRKYIDAGGNLLIAGEPGKQAVNNPLLRNLGVQMMNGTIVQRSSDFSFGLVTPYLTAEAAAMSPILNYLNYDSTPISMPSVAGLSYDHTGPFVIKPLLLTDPNKTWNKMGAFVLDSAALQFNAANGDQNGVFPTALSLTRMLNGKEQRILVASDADFLSNSELQRNNMNAGNFMLANYIFGWFAYGAFPIETPHPIPPDRDVTLTPASVTLIKWVYFGVIPGLFLVMGTVVLIRRKRK